MPDRENTPEAALGPTARDVATRAVRGSAYTAGAGMITMTLGLIRTVLLVRLLAPADFGLYALAAFFNTLAGQVRALGLETSLIQRRDAGPEVISTFFLMRMALLLGSVALVVTCAPLIARFYPAMPLLGTVIVAYAGLDVVHGLNGTQEAILRRELQFVRLAKIRVTASATMTVVAPSLAWVGFGVWSLVAEHAAGELARAALVWGPYRTWRPRWQWSREAARGFWGFGTRLWAGHNLSFLLHNFDDFWIGTALGSVALGFYSRAFDFGRYAERVFANPLLVTFPSLARLQRDRLRLSQSFFRITSVVVRSNAAAALVLILAAPEGARLAFGERWLPMVAPFQLLVLSALLGLVGHVAEEVFLAVGRPEVLVRIRALRLSLFLPGVILLGSFHGITGVALAGVLATLLGIGLVFHLVRQRVDYSPAKLFLWPTIAFVVVASSVLSTSSLWTGPLWLAVAGKAVVALVGYGVILVAAEREELATGYRFVRRFLSSDRVDDAGTDPGKG